MQHPFGVYIFEEKSILGYSEISLTTKERIYTQKYHWNYLEKLRANPTGILDIVTPLKTKCDLMHCVVEYYIILRMMPLQNQSILQKTESNHQTIP